MATVPEIVNALEADDALHLGRLLVLIDTFAGRKGDQTIEGLTKLAKLDFLLRYPAYLEKALSRRNAPDAALQVQEYERNSVEAHMVRFKFGPWDFRYRRFLNVLAAKGLCSITVQGRTIIIQATQKGRAVASSLLESGEFHAIKQRSTLLKRHLDIGAKALMDFIYDTFPELATMRYGEAIDT